MIWTVKLNEDDRLALLAGKVDQLKCLMDGLTGKRPRGEYDQIVTSDIGWSLGALVSLAKAMDIHVPAIPNDERSV